MLKKIISLLLVVFCGQLAASSTEPAKFIVVRHGEGEHNRQHIYSTWKKSEGGVDHSLTAKGREQVAETAQQLLKQGINKDTVGLVLVSPLVRTRETAQILMDYGVCSEKVMVIEERIREPVAKDWEGARIPPKKPNEESWTASVKASAEHGGETIESIDSRIAKVAEECFLWNPSKGHIILVTHGYPGLLFLQMCGEKEMRLNTGEARVVPHP